MSDTTATTPATWEQGTLNPWAGDCAHASVTLAHVNVPPAQTWNYLRVNDISLQVPAPVSAGAVTSRLPRLFEQVTVGIGAEAASWIEQAAKDATYLEVPAGTVRTEPIVVSVGAGEAADTGVLVREGATASIVIVARGDAQGPDALPTSASLVRVIAEREAHVSIVELVVADEQRQHLGGIGIVASEFAVIDVRQYALGGAKVALGISTALDGANARLAHTMRYLVRNNDVLDVNHVVRQRGRLTRAEVTTSGVLADTATKTMRETIDLVHGAKGAQGSEAETVLVTGDAVTNKTLPVILCDEEDVAGNHGASIGGVSQEQLSYLANRGIDEAAAEALFVRSLFDDAILHAPTQEAVDAVLSRAAHVLGDETAREIAEIAAQSGPRDDGQV